MVKPRVVGTGADQKIEPFPEDDRKRLEEAVQSAVGYSVERNDVVRVLNAPAPVTVDEAFVPPPAQVTTVNYVEMVERYMPGIATLLGVLVLGWIFYRSMKRLSTPTPVFEATVGDATGTGVSATPSLDVAQFQDLQHEAQDLVSKNSGQATAIIRGMLRS